MTRKPHLLPFAALGAGVLAISWSAIFVRWSDVPGLASAFYRLLIATVVLWSVRFSQRPSRVVVYSRRSLSIAALGGICFAGDVGLYNLSVLRTTAGGATFLGNNAPLVVGLLSWMLTRKAPTARFWIALLLQFAGTWLIVLVDHSHGAGRSYGDLLALLTSVCFALYLVNTEKVREHLDTLTIVAVSTASSSFVLLFIALVTKTSLRIPSLHSLLALVGLGFVCQLVGYFCLTYALGHLEVTVSSVVMLAVAPVTAVWALVFFGERMSTAQWIGGALILLAVWIVSRSPTTTTTPPPDLL